MKANKILIIGLDGATWELLSPWIEEGILPTIRHLIREGVGLTLLSTIPPYTPQAWTSLITGVNPGKHGILGFAIPKGNLLQKKLLNSTDIKSPILWDILNENGVSTGLINIPMTYPPRPVDGFMVTGMMTPSLESNFTYPPRLKDVLLNSIPNYVIDVPVGDRDRKSLSIIARIEKALEERAKVCFFLLKKFPVEFFFVVFETPDRLQHLFWKYLDCNSPLFSTKKGASIREKVKKIFKKLDQIIEELIEKWGQDALVILLSDHGFGPYEGIFYINNWLAEQGFLKKKNSMKSDIMANALKYLKLKKFAKYILPRKTLRDLKASTLESIDWTSSIAWSAPPPMQGIYIKKTIDSKNEIIAEIVSRLKEIKSSYSSDVLFKKIWRKEELYNGPYTHMAPDLILPGLDVGLDFSEALITRESIIWDFKNPRGNHRREGILIMYGKGVKTLGFLPHLKADIKDVMPTLLYYLGLHIPSHLEGSVLKNILTENF